MKLPISERERPPHFAGRHGQLAALNGRLDDMLRLASADGGLALITGVPGAGKTQLGRKFADLVRRREDVDAKCLVIEPELLADVLGLFLAVGDALDSADVFRRVAEVDTRVVNRGGAIGPLKANVTREHARHTRGFAALLRASRATPAWDGKALVVVVDELQGVQPAGMAALRVLHQGLHGCPIMLVGIGLQHTPRVLANPADGSSGISRPGMKLRLGALSEGEALEAVELGMVAMASPIDRSGAEALARASYGFPQHIHGYLAGACQAVAEHGGLESDAALVLALKIGEQRRSDYYNGRLGTLAPGHRAAMASVAAAMRDANTTELAWLDAVAAADKTPRVDGEAAIEDAVRHGVLTEREEGNLSFGIPSFHGHMRRQLERRDSLKGKVLLKRRSSLARGALHGARDGVAAA